MKGSKLPYHLRVNKCVDRQLFLEALGFVARSQPIDTMGYISMGGGYLEDFRVMHLAFNIVKMLSFDLEDWMITRQLKNRPYAFVSCKQASSTEIVNDFHDVRKNLLGTDGNVIVWLDYTEADQRYSQLSDLQELTSKLIEGDIFRITMNAHRPAFGRIEEYELAKASKKTEAQDVHEWWNDIIVEQLQEYMPQDRKGEEFIREEVDFATTLVSAVRIAALMGLEASPELAIEPMMSVVYADGQQMITVSGIVLRKTHRAKFLETTRWNDWQFKPGDHWTAMVALAVPHMSIAERHSIHELMTNPPLLFELDFKLDGDPIEHSHLIDQYVLHHRRYPTIGSINIQ